jgi:hypothetical protein
MRQSVRQALFASAFLAVLAVLTVTAVAFAARPAARRGPVRARPVSARTVPVRPVPVRQIRVINQRYLTPGNVRISGQGDEGSPCGDPCGSPGGSPSDVNQGPGSMINTQAAGRFPGVIPTNPTFSRFQFVRPAAQR